MENIKSETTGQKRIDTIATDIKNLHPETVVNTPFNRGRFFNDKLTIFLKILN